RACTRRHLRRALSTLPAMAGSASRGRARTRVRRARDRLYACKLLRRVQSARHHGYDPRPWVPAGVVSGDRGMNITQGPANIIAIALAIGLPPAAHAQEVADFYRGKTIEFLIGAAPAGGYDMVGRLIANHMPRHIPGNPAIVVRNMPGATGLIMTNYLYNIAR